MILSRGKRSFVTSTKARKVLQIFVINVTHEKIISLEYDRRSWEGLASETSEDECEDVKVKLENKVGIPHDR